MHERNDYDVIVAGLGPWGAASSWHLARRGLKVLGLDRHTPPHGYGSHGGATRLARQSNSTGTEYLPLTHRTFALWRELSAEAGHDLLVESGTVFIGKPGSGWFDRTLKSLETSAIKHEILDGPTTRSRFPAFEVDADETAVFEPHGTVALVVEGIEALHAQARRHGAELRFETPVEAYSEDADGVEVRTPSGTYRADRLVVAVGAWSGQLLGLDLPVAVERQVLFNFAAPEGSRPETAVYFSAPPGDDAAPFYGCPEPDGSFKVSLPSRGNEIAPDQLSDHQPTESELAVVREYVRKRIPGIDGDPIHSTVCMWSEVADGHWVIGAHPKHRRIIFGAGCMGRGFRYAPVVGEALADLATGIERSDMAMFAPERFRALV
ncbi:N-methyl-L-tryptophan oxidase [Streptomyces sp. NPDC050121]|uniref:N-methyl-L-tryptophan oxidase n=1 Tax=Streptomyces sp. NPDC050121 TaxID=3365601 RepID=UPI0037A577F6